MSAPGNDGGELRYEQTDARPGALFRFAVVLSIGIAAAAGVALGVFGYLQRMERRLDPPPPPLGRRAPGELPPEPRLQTLGVDKPGATPFQELDDILAEERRTLSSYGWSDRSAGVVHIPIEDAMKKLVDEGLPPAVTAAPPPPPAGPAEATAGSPSPSPRGRPSPPEQRP